MPRDASKSSVFTIYHVCENIKKASAKLENNVAAHRYYKLAFRNSEVLSSGTESF
jgi:hypothetical protein